jgi:hypothetical protein
LINFSLSGDKLFSPPGQWLIIFLSKWNVFSLPPALKDTKNK